MRRIAVSLSLFIAISNVLTAQYEDIEKSNHIPELDSNEFKPKFLLETGPSVGYSFSTFLVNEEGNNNPNIYKYENGVKSKFTFLGAVTELFLPRISPNLSFQLEIFYQKFDYSMVRRTSQGNNASTFYYTIFTQESLSFPFTFKYHLPNKGSPRLFFQAGGTYEYQLNSKLHSTIQQFTGTDIITSHEGPYNILNQWGLMTGLGFAQNFTFFKLSLSTRYIHQFNLFEESGIKINTNRVAIVAAVQF